MSNCNETNLVKSSAEKAKEKWDKYFMDTYAQMPIVIDKGEGATVVDVDGKKYIDFTSGYGASSLGYNNEKLVKALQEQVSKITHVSNLFFSQPIIDAGEKLIKASKMSKVFFINSGSEATELAMKIARKYSSQKYGENRGTILSLKDSFHGRTMMALMATGVDKYHKYFYPLPEGFKYTEKNNIEDFKKVVEDKSICAVLMEPIQGEGGVHVLEEDYLKEVIKICHDKDILVIFDEVQCGIGRSGKLFAYNHYNLQPDIVAIAKGIGAGIPVSGVLTNEKTSSVLKPGDHGSTFGGNILAMTAVSVVLDEIEAPGFYEEVEVKGKYIMNYIKNLNSEKVVEVRGKGLMIGVELNINASDIIDKCVEGGVLFVKTGENAIRMLPPLVITYDEMNKGLEVLKKYL